jgi:hypothetical protein
VRGPEIRRQLAVREGGCVQVERRPMELLALADLGQGQTLPAVAALKVTLLERRQLRLDPPLETKRRDSTPPNLTICNRVIQLRK